MKNVFKFIFFAVFAIGVTSCSVTNLIVNQVMKADANNDGVVSWNEWDNKAQNDPDTAEAAKRKGVSKADYIRNSFNEFDLNKDNKITKEELQKAME